MKAYLQNADGSERTLVVTEPDPADGTYCAHLSEEQWVRIVPEREIRIPLTVGEATIARVLQEHNAQADESPQLCYVCEEPILPDDEYGIQTFDESDAETGPRAEDLIEAMIHERCRGLKPINQ